MEKKEVKPINALISFIVHGSGKDLNVSVLAIPGCVPDPAVISYPRYEIDPVPMWHLLGFIFRLCSWNCLKTFSKVVKDCSCERALITMSSI